VTPATVPLLQSGRRAFCRASVADSGARSEAARELFQIFFGHRSPLWLPTSDPPKEFAATLIGIDSVYAFDFSSSGPSNYQLAESGSHAFAANSIHSPPNPLLASDSIGRELTWPAGAIGIVVPLRVYRLLSFELLIAVAKSVRVFLWNPQIRSLTEVP